MNLGGCPTKGDTVERPPEQPVNMTTFRSMKTANQSTASQKTTSPSTSSMKAASHRGAGHKGASSPQRLRKKKYSDSDPQGASCGASGARREALAQQECPGKEILCEPRHSKSVQRVGDPFEEPWHSKSVQARRSYVSPDTARVSKGLEIHLISKRSATCCQWDIKRAKELKGQAHEEGRPAFGHKELSIQGCGHLSRGQGGLETSSRRKLSCNGESY